jgi:polysaccharide biosynthesis transport protein
MRASALSVTMREPAAPSRVAGARQAAPGGDLGSLLRLIRRNLPSIILSTAAAMALGVVYLALAKPQYTATSAIFVDPRQKRIVSEEATTSSSTNDIALFESQVSIIGSDTILRRVVDREGLKTDIEFVPASSGSSGGILSDFRKRISGPRPQQDPTTQALAALAKKIRVRRAQNTYVVNVDVTTDDAVKSAQIANAILKAFQDDQAAAKADQAAKINGLIDGRLDELKSQVRVAEVRADEFKRDNKLITSEGGMLNEQQLTKLNTELVAVRGQVAGSKARLDEMTATLRRGLSPEALPEAMTSPVIQRLREQLSTFTGREAALASRLKSGHPAMADAHAQVVSIRSQIAAELQRIATQAQNDFQIVSGREREIQRKIAELETEVANTTTSQIKLREYEREADASREVLRAFLARAKETQEQQNLSIAEARVITPAAVPPRPSSPNGPLVLAFAALSGLALAMMRALLKASLAPAAATGPRLALEGQNGPLRSIGAIPRLTQAGSIFRGFGRTPPVSPTDMMTAIADGGNANQTAFRRSVQGVAGRLRAHDRSDAPQVLLLVAGARDTGTSMSALSIAYARALAGDKTLLIDAASSDATLSTLFAGDLVQDQPCVLDSKEHLASITSRDTRSGLVFLPMALADLNALTPHQRTRLANGISKLAQDFDVVVIDGGALPEDPGVTALAQLASAVVVVARAGTYDDAEAQDLIAILGVDPSQVAGVLDTMTDIGSTD